MKILTLVLAVVFHAALAFPQSPGTSPRSGDRGTMRLDYYHTGNATEERFSVDRVVRRAAAVARESGAADRHDQSRQVLLRSGRRGHRNACCTRAASARSTASGRRPPKRRRSTGRFRSRCAFPRRTTRPASSSRSATRGTCFAMSGARRSIRRTSSSSAALKRTPAR